MDLQKFKPVRESIVFRLEIKDNVLKSGWAFRKAHVPVLLISAPNC